ncbi:MAG: tyrosine-protein phosphatase [Candidatus Melainabacteria bacterium]|nr:tyrosine-protein phosphatase [Candidatus Melainabacteria bacterium]
MSPLLTRVNLSRAFALALSAAYLISIGASAADSPSSATTTKAVKVKEDLPNFHQVHPYLYRGGEPSKEGLRKIKDMGITTIFDLRNPGEKAYDEKEAAKELGIRYISMPMNSKAPTAKQIKRMVDEIDKAKDNAVSKDAIFVHCAHGSDRTGCMIGIWRVMRDGYDYDTAYKEMRKYWFTPKFTNLSGAVRSAAGTKSQ